MAQEENKVSGDVPCIWSQTIVTVRSPGDWNRGSFQAIGKKKKISVGPGLCPGHTVEQPSGKGYCPLAALTVWAISHRVHASPCPGSTLHICVVLGQRGSHLLSGKKVQAGL